MIVTELITLLIIIWVGVACVVGADAEERNRSAKAWFIVVSLTGLIGFAFYILAIIPNSSSENALGESSSSENASGEDSLSKSISGENTLSENVLGESDSSNQSENDNNNNVAGTDKYQTNWSSRKNSETQTQSEVDMSRNNIYRFLSECNELLFAERYVPKPNLNIVETKAQTASGDATVTVIIENTEREVIVVGVKVLVQVEEIHKNKKVEFPQYMSTVTTLSPDSNNQIKINSDFNRPVTSINIVENEGPYLIFNEQDKSVVGVD